MTQLNSPVDLWRSALSGDPGSPFLTFYDDATGERIELSCTSTDNWVAKTANLIVDELGAALGDRMALLLPTHWLTVVWYLAAWSAGLLVAPGADPAGADLAVADAETIEATTACPGERVLVSTTAFGAPRSVAPSGALDYATEVAAHGDRFGPRAVPPTDPILEHRAAQRSAAEVARVAVTAAQEHGLSRTSRLLFAGDLATESGLTSGLLAPLGAGASIVLCRNLDETKLDDRLRVERVTHHLT